MEESKAITYLRVLPLHGKRTLTGKVKIQTSEKEKMALQINAHTK
jgi:hypothetical protein